MTDPTLKAEIGRIYQEAHHPHIDHAAELDPEREASGGLDIARWHTDNIHRAPVLVLVCGIQPFETLGWGEQVGVHSSFIPAAWSFMLAARARGLGTCWTTIHLMKHANEMAKLLGVPEGCVQFGLFPVGYYTGETFNRA